MNALFRYRRLLAITMLALFATLSIAPLAEANNGRGRGHRNKASGYVVERRVAYAPQPTYYRRSSNVGPVLAGVVIGTIIGAAISHAPARAEQYVYWDPYGGRSYSSFDDCNAHLSSFPGPRVVYQVETCSGRCVDAWRWSRDGWHRFDGRVDSYGGGYSRGGYDDRYDQDSYDDRYDRGGSYDDRYDRGYNRGDDCRR